MKLTAVSFSYAKNSMQTRGILLLNHKLNFENIIDIHDIPVCDSNKSDGVVPDSVIEFDKALENADAEGISINHVPVIVVWNCQSSQNRRQKV